MAADKKISELPVISVVSATDASILVHNGTDYQFDFTALLEFIHSGINTGANISFGNTLPQNNTGKNGDVFVNTTTNAFAQKTSGTWQIVYTLPASGSSADATVLYGSGIPGTGIGNNNDTYININTGIFYKKSAGTWAQVFSMQTGPQGPKGDKGDTGETGSDGKTILSGTSNPSNSTTGADGDFYLNTNTLQLFGPKISGVWGDGVSIVGLQGEPGDTGLGVPTGGITGQVLAKVNGTDFNTVWVDQSGDGDVSDLEEKQITFGAADGTLAQNAEFKFDPDTKSLYVGISNEPHVEYNGNIHFMGDSITQGAGASVAGKNFSAILASVLGLTEQNHGINGGMIMNQIPGNMFGGWALLDHLDLIPIKTAGDALLVFQYGINDFNFPAPNYTVANFKAAYQIAIDNALSKGWVPMQIIIGTLTYINPAEYKITVAYPEQAVPDLARHLAFNTAIEEVAAEYGLHIADVYNSFKNGSGVSLLKDYVHPNDIGHHLLTLCHLRALMQTVIKEGQGIATNQLLEAAQLKLKQLKVIPTKDAYVLGIMPDGTVGIVSSVRGNQAIDGDLIYNGSITPSRALKPIGFGAQDILLGDNGKIWGTYGDTFANYIQLSNIGARMTLFAAFGIVIDSHLFKSGNIGMNGAGRQSGNAGSGGYGLDGDLYMSGDNGIESGYGGGWGRIVPFKDGNTYYRNCFGTGKHIFATKNGGGDNAQTNVFAIFPDGSIQSKPVTDVFSLPDVGFEMGVPRKGFLMPRLTSAERDALGKVVITAVGGSSTVGYTTATVVFTGGGGTGAAGTAVLVGGKLQNIIMTNSGGGYTSFPIITLVGDGTGQPDIEGHTSLPEGLEIYNFSTHKKNWFNGTNWQEAVNADAV